MGKIGALFVTVTDIDVINIANLICNPVGLAWVEVIL